MASLKGSDSHVEKWFSVNGPTYVDIAPMQELI